VQMSLPAMVLPGQTLPGALTVPAPTRPGTYRIDVWVERAERCPSAGTQSPAVASIELAVVEAGQQTQHSGALAEAVHEALAHAHYLCRLPEDYCDVTEGFLAGCKRWLKSKLLNNFKRAFVAVAFRRQSAFNREVLTVLQELLDHSATLQQAVQLRPPPPPHVVAGTDSAATRDPQSAITEMAEELVMTRERCGQLEERLARLEGLLEEQENRR